jgi:hypothetical protein
VNDRKLDAALHNLGGPHYYKATRIDGTDFYSGTINYATALETGKRIRVRTPARSKYVCCTGDVLHAGLTATDVWAGTSWPLRLFEVMGKPVAQEGRKVGLRSLAVVREVPAHLAFGPHGEHVAALIARAYTTGADEAKELAAARDAARDAARGAARAAARDAARDAARGAAWDAAGGAAGDAAWEAAWDAAWGAAWGAAGALIIRDLIGDQFTQAHYDLLTGPWRRAIGPVHPDDAVLS